MSEKTGRGPLRQGWIRMEHLRGRSDGILMCAYKLCRINVDIPIMKDGLEKLIVDFVRTHLLEEATQAWVLQDEWHDLNVKVISEKYWCILTLLNQRYNQQGNKLLL